MVYLNSSIKFRFRHFIITGQRVSECIEGENITLLCSSNSSNALRVKPKWLKNDLELTLGKFIQQPNIDLLMT